MSEESISEELGTESAGGHGKLKALGALTLIAGALAAVAALISRRRSE